MRPIILSGTVARVPIRRAKSTQHGIGPVVVLYIALFASILQNTLADLPIHATTSDIFGLWSFSLTPPVRGVVHSCGSTTPNKNSTNLRPELQDFKSYLETHGGQATAHEIAANFKGVRETSLIQLYTICCGDSSGVYKEVRLRLTDEPVPFSVTRKEAAGRGLNRQSWKALGVFDGEKADALVGSWTTVYDEGFEVNVGDNTRLMGFMKYSLDPACKGLPRDGDLEDRTGNTRCYVTDANRTHMGWYNQDNGDGELLFGCFYAERLDGPAERDASAFVVIQEAQTPENVSFLSATQTTASSLEREQQKTPRDLTYYVSQDFVNKHNASPTSSWRAGLNPVFAHLDGAALSKYIKNFGVKKFHPINLGKYHAPQSFMQSSTSFASEDIPANQLYACPCKKGERPLDTRKETSEASVPVLSPMSALELNDWRAFSAPIAPHVDNASVSAKTGKKQLHPTSKNSVEALVHLHSTTEANREEPLYSSTPLAFLDVSSEKMPASFSWSDPFSATAFNEDVINQGTCGSCYAVAATYALQKRFEIAASKMLGREVRLFGQPSTDPKASGENHAMSFVDLRDTIGAHGGLSAQSVLSCSFYNQGCDGGFPYLVGKHAREIGIPQEQCMRYQATDKTSCPLQADNPSLDGEKASLSSFPAESFMETGSKACMSNARWFARDYGYVGSCYECNQCSGEKMIMEEVLRNGPVVVALEAPEALFSYHNGVFDVDSSHNHSRVCDVTSEKCQGFLTGWEFTNHAVALDGWGEEESAGNGAEPQKYWIVRNTWGPSWGKNGYVKIARGKNLGGIESQATWIDPDFTRGMGKEVAQRIEALKKTAVQST